MQSARKGYRTKGPADGVPWAAPHRQRAPGAPRDSGGPSTSLHWLPLPPGPSAPLKAQLPFPVSSALQPRDLGRRLPVPGQPTAALSPAPAVLRLIIQLWFVSNDYVHSKHRRAQRGKHTMSHTLPEAGVAHRHCSSSPRATRKGAGKAGGGPWVGSLPQGVRVRVTLMARKGHSPFSLPTALPGRGPGYLRPGPSQSIPAAL